MKSNEAMIRFVAALAANSAVQSEDVLAKAKRLLADMQAWNAANPDPEWSSVVATTKLRDELQAAKATIAAQEEDIATMRGFIMESGTAGLGEK